MQEIRTRYASTFAGIVWSVVQPLMRILMYWLVFSYGLKIQPASNIPFILFFLCGLIPWTLMSEALAASTDSIVGNAHLVKKTIFPTEILPVVHLFASLVTHMIMLIILLAIMLGSGLSFSIYNFQFIYYLFSLSVFVLGLSWVLSALNVFYRDVSQIFAVIINMWFWLTPIVWPLSMMEDKYQLFFMLNPIYYIVNGYRDSFINHKMFWDQLPLSVYYWSITFCLFVLGGLIFRRLKTEFADVL